MKILTYLLTFLIMGSGAGILYLKKSNEHLKEKVQNLETEVKEKQGQYEAMIWDSNNALTLSRYQLANLKTETSRKLDSVLRVNKIRANEAISGTVIKQEYKDTTKVKAEKKQPIAIDDKYYIPVNWDDGCWGMSGQIETSDKLAELSILDRKFSNSIQLIVTKEKKFLFFRIRKADYKAFSDCGDINIQSVKFVK